MERIPQTLEEAIAIIAEQRATIADLTAQVAALTKLVSDLTAKLSQNSGNSSRPPSTDPPGTKRLPIPRPGSGRKRGGQPGHQKNGREFLAVEDVDKVNKCYPENCRKCARSLADGLLLPDFLRHQVTEIPPVKAYTTEHQLYSVGCPWCNTITCATLPLGAPKGQFGPRLQAIVSMCGGAYRLSKRATVELLGDWFGVSLSLGSISNLEQGTSGAVASPVEEVKRAITAEPIVHADETGWFEKGKRAWLWVGVTAQMALFMIDGHRSTASAKRLLGALFGGILVSDRYSAYNWIDAKRRQVCWSHLIRDFKSFADRGAEAKALSKQLLALTYAMFHEWHRVRDGTITRTEFRRWMDPVEPKIEALLEAGIAIEPVGKKCKSMFKLKVALWTFVRVEGVEPTNNHAERTVRHAVLWRKGCFGTDSANGSEFVGRILTVVGTLRLQKRNVLEYLTAACDDANHQRPTASLLPSAERPQIAQAA